MVELFELAKVVLDEFESLELDATLIGSLALQRWGEVRMTRDIDISLMTHFENEPEIIKSLLVKFDSRIANAYEFAVNNRVLLIKVGNVGIDVGLAGFPY